MQYFFRIRSKELTLKSFLMNKSRSYFSFFVKVFEFLKNSAINYRNRKKSGQFLAKEFF